MPSMSSSHGCSGYIEASMCITKASAGFGGTVHGLLPKGGSHRSTLARLFHKWLDTNKVELLGYSLVFFQPANASIVGFKLKLK